jgi:hypothetical protein
LLALAAPASAGLSAAHVPVPVYLVGVGLAGGVGYLATVRLLFAGTWHTVLSFVASVLPLERLPRIRRRRRRSTVGDAVGDVATSPPLLIAEMVPPADEAAERGPTPVGEIS